MPTAPDATCSSPGCASSTSSSLLIGSATWQDPQLPKSIWYHTNAQFLGFRIVRPLKTPSAAEMQAYWNSGVEKDNPALKKAE